ncbi:hypothetical protein [Cytobacillus firmus]|uniref:Uncharacterized protein n=1 Tax=Cytobacillus firmus DS1 TaxID=1307436 RepID=W7LA90_CYTFI|nr:hypothetical protein [Cytobacillus firmus]EWG08734.1 hypothetical protein PBF_22517 [Cytobacillus firmus DS1]
MKCKPFDRGFLFFVLPGQLGWRGIPGLLGIYLGTCLGLAVYLTGFGIYLARFEVYLTFGTILLTENENDYEDRERLI